MNNLWQCDDLVARAAIDSLVVKLNAAQPSLGLFDCRFNNCDVPGEFFQIDPERQKQAPKIVDQYTRGNDLVVTYAETPQCPVRKQVYWRALLENTPVGSLVGIDLIISMQTNLLNSDPTLRVVSVLPPGEQAPTTSAHGNLVLHRPAGVNVSIALCVFPTDLERAETSSHQRTLRVIYHLFRPGLEKGVIRRARLRAVFLPRGNDEQLAAAAFQSLADSALPLTT